MRGCCWPSHSPLVSPCLFGINPGQPVHTLPRRDAGLHTASRVLCMDVALLAWTQVINFRGLQLPSRDEGATGHPTKHSPTSCPTRYLIHSPYSSAGLTQIPHQQEQAAHRYAVFKHIGRPTPHVLCFRIHLCKHSPQGVLWLWAKHQVYA